MPIVIYEAMTTLKTPQNIRDYVDNIFTEATTSALKKRALVEKDKQDATSSQVSQEELFPDDKETTAQSEKKSEASTSEPEKPVADNSDKEKLESGDVTPDDVIETLNSIRAGKSFSRDENVKNSLSKYVDELSKAEKTALLAFLKGISQIVTGVVDSEQATEPEDPAPAVSMKKDGSGGSGNTKHVKPNVVKGNAGAPAKTTKTAPSPGEEDTSAPVKTAPIQPSKR